MGPSACREHKKIHSFSLAMFVCVGRTPTLPRYCRSQKNDGRDGNKSGGSGKITLVSRGGGEVRIYDLPPKIRQ